jgi:iron complex transport system substrate-binding protein
MTPATPAARRAASFVLPFVLAAMPIEPAAAQQVRVAVTIDFGPLAREALRGTVTVPAGATAVDATRALAAVEQDRLCCSPDDVWSIAGIGPDPRLDRCWMWKLGARMGPDLPARYRVVDGDSITWTYVAGRAPQLTERVVSLLPAATEIAFAIGAESALVGISHLCEEPPGRSLPRVLSTSVDSERWSMGEIDRFLRAAGERREPLYRLDEAGIRALAPTLVVSQGLCPVCAATPDQAEQALAGGDAAACAKLLVLSPHSLADVAANIRELGAAVGRADAARIAALAFERRIAAARARPRPQPRPRVVVLEWFDPPWVSGEWIAEMVEAAGGEALLAGPKDASRCVEWQDVVAADPDVVVLAACSMSIERTRRELPALQAVPAFAALRAVRDGRAFVLDGERHVSTPGPGLAEGFEVLCDVLAGPPGDAPGDGRWERLRASSRH